MSHEQFEAWWSEWRNEHQADGINDKACAWAGWQGSRKSPGVTPELARMAVSIFQDRPATEDDVLSMQVALEAVLAKLKEM